MPEINWDDIQDSTTIEAIKGGVYRWKIVEVDDSRLTSKGHRIWRMKLVCMSAGDEGHPVWDNLIFSPEAAPRIKMLYQQIGLAGKGKANLQTEDLEGKTIYAKITVEDYNGQSQNKVIFDGYNIRHVPADFNVPADAPAGAPRSTPAPGAPDQDEDDLPF